MCKKISEELLSVIQQGEGLTVEYKKSTRDITKDVYETVCSFSNREGGHIFLGVKDNGAIIGVDSDCIDRMKKDFVTSINNGNKMYPPLYLQPEEIDVDGRKVLYIYVPVSPSVCRCAGRIYDRNNDADIDITDNEYLVYQLYARKQDTYYVNKVFPVFSISDLRADLIERAKGMASSRVDKHPWKNMSNEELLRSAKLILMDPLTGKEGITLAAILLFGSDNLIASVLAHHKTDAILRIYTTDRYDDRDVITTNLLDSYDRLMDFGKRHMNDVFTMDGIVSVSSRDKILREIVSNLLVHRDFSNGFVAKLIIEKDQLITENANRMHGHGSLNLATFKPFPKNPVISSVFREIGLADELGSGMRNAYKYTYLYSGAEPRFVEGDVFQTIIPLNEAATAMVGPSRSTVYVQGAGASDGVGDGVNTGIKRCAKEINRDIKISSDGVGDGVNKQVDFSTINTDYEVKKPSDGVGVVIKMDGDKLRELIDFCKEERTRAEMMNFCEIRSDSYFRINILNPLLKTGVLKRTIPDKPNSSRQKYVKG